MDKPLQRTDAELVEAACDGDVDSFRTLYEKYYGLAFGLARSRLGDQHLAEDAAQEAFAVACRKLHTLSKPHRFPEWLGTICRRTASKLARKQGSVEPFEDSATEKSTNETVRTTVQEALSKLPVNSREVLNLHYLSGMTYEEISQTLGISFQAVHGRMQRARKNLSRYLVQDT